jgi:hypothetical protein
MENIKKLEDCYNKKRHNQNVFHVYLLLRGSEFNNLDMADLTFQTFLSSVFYIGKGAGNRPLDHLRDANKHRIQGTSKDSKVCPSTPSSSKMSSSRTKSAKDDTTGVAIPNAIPNKSNVQVTDDSAKFDTINSEWDNGFGVIAFKCIDMIHSNEAHTRGAFMIDAFGKSHNLYRISLN